MSSNNNLAVSVRGLGKNYKIAHNTTAPTSFREAIAHRMRHPFGEQGQATETFWALKDVNFDIAKGEIVGVIGRNGAGKSTLLKILSRITTPSTGTLDLHGRLSSLLEVGTGFHAELTGRENIYLNGSILGMSRREISRKFDEVVEFSGVERFLDTPVKRYSSGMYVRLAFAVAAHLDQDILILDEVLAVGDAEFQNKCLKKMDDVSSQEGRTVIYVSHNVASVRALCKRVILMKAGTVALDGSTEEGVAAYLGSVKSTGASWVREEPAGRDALMYIKEISVRNPRGETSGHLSNEEPIEIQVAVHSGEDVPGAQVAIRVTNYDGIAVFTTTTSDGENFRERIDRGDHLYQVKIPKRFLATGHYKLLVVAHIPNRVCYDLVEDLVNFSVEDLDPAMARLRDGREGVVTPVLHWVEVGA